MAVPKKLVLVADDERASRDYLAAVLEDEYDVLGVGDGAKAVEAAKARGPSLVILDVQMPNKDGFSALYDLRQDPATKAIPVILVTGSVEKTGVRFRADSIEEYMGERPDAVMGKPIDPDMLLQAVRQFVAP
jgi:CheY-like chemotaxis protein